MHSHSTTPEQPNRARRQRRRAQGAPSAPAKNRQRPAAPSKGPADAAGGAANAARRPRQSAPQSKLQRKSIALRPAPSRVAPAHSAAYVAVAGGEPCRFVAPMSTAFFETASAVSAEVVDAAATKEPIAQIRGYEGDDLMAVAEIGYHYLMSGGLKLALALFDGLAAVAPNEPYFALALGLTHDRLDDTEAALRWYRRAGELDSGDGRPDVNRAELHVEAGDVRSARRLLARGAKKATVRGDQDVARKARAILAHLERGARRQLGAPRIS